MNLEVLSGHPGVSVFGVWLAVDWDNGPYVSSSNQPAWAYSHGSLKFFQRKNSMQDLKAQAQNWHSIISAISYWPSKFYFLQRRLIDFHTNKYFIYIYASFIIVLCLLDEPSDISQSQPDLRN